MSVSTATASGVASESSARRSESVNHTGPARSSRPGSSASKGWPSVSASAACWTTGPASGRSANSPSKLAPAAAPGGRPSMRSKRRLQRTSMLPRR